MTGTSNTTVLFNLEQKPLGRWLVSAERTAEDFYIFQWELSMTEEEADALGDRFVRAGVSYCVNRIDRNEILSIEEYFRQREAEERNG